MKKDLYGVLPCILTPYDKNLDIDAEDYQRQVDYIYDVGCQGFVIGQVSEVMRLNQRERDDMCKLAVDCNADRGVVIVSTGAESIKNAIEYSQKAQDFGADAILLMHPATTALNESQMYQYYESVVKSIEIPVMIHHAKSYAKTNLSIETQIKLLHQFGSERILFKPESSPTPPKLSQLRDMSQGKARIFEGDGGMMLIDCHKRGLAGTIPAADTAKIVHSLWQALENGDLEKARRIAYPLSYLMCQFMNSVDCYQHLGKHILKRMGIIKNTTVRGPYDYIPDTETIREIEITHEYIASLLN